MTIETIKVGPYDLCVRTDGNSYFHKYFRGGITYEDHVHAELNRLIPKSVGFLDVGCNVGIHVLGAKTIDPDVPVYAFDASPRNIEMLCMTVNRNALTKVHIFPVAAADRDGIVWFNVDEENSQPLGTKSEVHFRPWPACQIGRLVRPGDVSVIKTDIEGYEFNAWQGMTAILSSKPRPALIFEVSFPAWQNTGIDPVKAMDWLIGLGYHLTVLEKIPGMRAGPFPSGQLVVNHIRDFNEVVADILAE